jgi:hypothetical protein
MPIALRPTPAPVPMPAVPCASMSMAWSLPPLAPIFTVWRESGRLPVHTCSSWRSHMSLTGALASRASSPAMKPMRLPGAEAPNLAPNPPPMNSVITCTSWGASPNTSASSSRTLKMPWVEAHTVMDLGPSQRTTSPWVSSAEWVCTWVT